MPRCPGLPVWRASGAEPSGGRPEEQVVGEPAPEPGRGVLLPAQGPDRRLQVHYRHSRLFQQQKDPPPAAELGAEELLQVFSVQHPQEVPVLGHLVGQVLLYELRGQVLQQRGSASW